MKAIVDRLAERCGSRRSAVYGRLASILLTDPYAEDLPIFFDALRQEGSEAAGAVGAAARNIQNREDQRRILDFHLGSTSPTPRVVLRALQQPTPEVEAILVRLLDHAKARFQSGDLEAAIGELHAVLDASHLVPYLDLSARFYLAMALEQTGKPDGALAQYQRVVELEPAHSRAREAIDRLALPVLG